MLFDINDTPVLEAHDENPFLKRKRPFHEKLAYVSGALGIGIIIGLIVYVVFVRGFTTVKGILTEAPLPTGTPPKNTVLLDKSTSSSAHPATRSTK